MQPATTCRFQAFLSLSFVPVSKRSSFSPSVICPHFHLPAALCPVTLPLSTSAAISPAPSSPEPHTLHTVHQRHRELPLLLLASLAGVSHQSYLQSPCEPSINSFQLNPLPCCPLLGQTKSYTLLTSQSALIGQLTHAWSNMGVVSTFCTQ